MKNKKIIFLAGLLAVITPLFYGSYVMAADYFPKGAYSSGNVVVDGPEEFRNLYVGGGSVIVNKKILGDLYAAGGSVNVAGEIEKDLMAAGGNVTLSTPVLEDAKLVGGNIAVNAPVGGDLLVAGGTVSISSSASVGGDLWVAGGMVNITAPVNGDLKVAGGEIIINSAVNGNVDVQADEKLVFGPQAVVLGTVTYTGRKAPVIETGAQVGTVDIKPFTKYNKGNFKGAYMGVSFMKSLLLLVAGLVLLRFMRTRVTEVVAHSKENFWRKIGIGLLSMVAIPLLAVLLFVTILGSMLGAILLFWFIFALILCSVLSTIVIGSFMENWLHKKKVRLFMRDEQKLTWSTVVVGTVCGMILAIIPVLGWVVLCIVYLATFGSMLKMVKEKMLDA